MAPAYGRGLPTPRPIPTAEQRWSATRDAHQLAELRVKEAALGKKIASKYEKLVEFVVSKNQWEQEHKWQTRLKNEDWTALNDEHTRIFNQHKALEEGLAGLQAERKEIKKIHDQSMPAYRDQERSDLEEERSRQSFAADVDRHRPAFEKRVKEHIERLDTRQKERRELLRESNEQSM